MIVRLTAEGAVVQDPDDLTEVRLRTDLDDEGMRTALATTATGEPAGRDAALLDVTVLRSLAVLSPTARDWPQRWEAMIEDARRRGALSADGRMIRVSLQR